MKTHLDLFSGIGGFAIAAQACGYTTIGFCEKEKYAQAVLRQHWPKVPICDDVNILIDKLEVAENVSICTEILFAAISSATQTSPTSKLFGAGKEPSESKSNASNAEKSSRNQKALPTGERCSAHGNAERRTCAEQMEPTLEAVIGCVEAQTQTGKAALETSAGSDTTPQKSSNGDAVYLPGMDTNASDAETSPKDTTNFARTTSLSGRTFRFYDLNSVTGQQYAKPAINGFTAHRTNGNYSSDRRIDLLTAGTPCQPASVAGKRGGTSDDRWLWPATLKVAAILRPHWLIFENVFGFVTLNDGLELESVLSDLEGIGYAAWPLVIPACAVDARHRRDRVWIVAHAARELQHGSGKPRDGRGQHSDGGEDVAHAAHLRGRGRAESAGAERAEAANDSQDDGNTKRPRCEGDDHNAKSSRGIQHELAESVRWEPEPELGRVAHGIPHRAHRLRGLGNAIVPQVAYEIIRAIPPHIPGREIALATGAGMR
jgi:DNA (cytosine-5)-methyltransferase 1